MSTQKDKITDPKKARRRTESILAETLICKACGWKIEFLSGGYESFTILEIRKLMEHIAAIYGEKLWLNIGALDREELDILKPYCKGVCGAVETVNEKIHDSMCPSKPVSDILEMYKAADDLGLEKGMTMIIGLGETLEDIPSLFRFIEDNGISRITFYALVPHGPEFCGPETAYYTEWIRQTRLRFPDLDIVAGSWHDRLEEGPLRLEAGADSFTKFQAVKLFGTDKARKLEEEVALAGRRFEGTLTKFPDFDIEKETQFLPPDLRERVLRKFYAYRRSM